ncbi:MAG: DUF2834 domain-containing protein [Alphaproteobacteria bacterium]|nr:DUF2834 domain-containing protein [Alphaproteobacteria bacterium]
MSTQRIALCAVYGAIAVIALVATWSQNLAYFHTGPGDFFAAFGAFLSDTKVTPAARSITVDIGLFFLAAAVFMVIEARKHKVAFVWAYIIGGTAIAISVTFPLFLIARELRLAQPDATHLRVVDIVPLAAFAALILYLTYWIDVA